jgi:MYXO-CTERM domain-containing protein
MMILALLAAQPALAWTHTGFVWDQNQFPLDWIMTDYIEDSLPQTPEYGPKKDQYYQEFAVEKGFEAWETGAPCAGVKANYTGMVKGINFGSDNDGIRTFYYDDPEGQLGAGVLGLTYSYGTGTIAFSFGGKTYTYLADTDIVFNNDVAWATTEDVESGQCNNQYAIEGVATHEIGHSWGMNHSCEEDDICSDQDLKYATMYWSAGPCSTWQVDLNDDDIEGITALYGPYATFKSDDQVRGGVPLDVSFQLVTNDAQVTEAEWSFGDGTGSKEFEPSHTYTEAGQYTVSVTFRGDTPECGDWEYTQFQRAYVVACGEPAPGLDTDGKPFDSMFTIEHYDGLVYQLINQTDTSVYGCLESVHWKVMKGDELISESSAWSPKVEFPSEGDYTIELEIGGPGGVVTEELDVTAVDKVGEQFKKGACATAPGTAVPPLGALALSALAFGLAARRRR